MNVELIAIVGGSGSGKTWLARQLLAAFAPDAARLSLDDFYRDLSHLPLAERERTNFDDPDSIDWPLFQECLTSIRRGGATRLPQYDFTTHTRRRETRPWLPCRLVVIDGLWLLHRPELRDLYRLGIFVDCPPELRLRRRVERDVAERGRSEASVHEQFTRHVAPMHDRFVADQVRHAGLVVPSPVVAETLARLTRQCREWLGGEGAR